MNDKELINFMYYLHHRTETRFYDSFNNIIKGYKEFINSAQSESLSDRDNEQAKEVIYEISNNDYVSSKDIESRTS